MTTNTLDTTGTATAVHDAVRAMAPMIAGRADEIEHARRLPPDLVSELTEAGCFRLVVPARYGGIEADLADGMEMVRLLARADGSVAWTTMIGSVAPIVLGLLPRETVDEIFGAGPDVILAGAFNPTGIATPVDGGYRVSGQWSFASGCQHAHWFIGHCFVDDGRMPPVRMMVLPPSDVEILDTWRTAGLCGTGSHDFAAHEVFVPDARTFTLEDDSKFETPLFHIPELSLSSMLIATVAVGIAEGALEEVTALATAKVPAFAESALATNPLFQYQLGEAVARLAATRALLDSEAAAAWARAIEGVEFTPEQRARIRAAATWATRTAADVVDTAYTAAGGSALYARSPLQRRLRDVHAVTQHFAVKADTYTKAGAVLTGQAVDLTFL
jgi:alkylation response protein AidB-like acyl-CoA dehydrogenase